MRKNNRKKLAVMLSAAMLMSILPASAFAESRQSQAEKSALAEAAPASGGVTMDEANTAPVDAAISKEKAEALARQYVSIPKDYVLQGANLSKELISIEKRNSWGLDFVKKVNGKQLGSVYVRIHAENGQLLEFRSYNDNTSSKPTYPLKVERSSAQQVALGFIQSIGANYKDRIQYNPDYGLQLLPPLTGEVLHTLRYDRIENGIPYIDNYIDLEVDSEGHVRSYLLRWDETIEFPKIEAVLTAEQANEKLRAAAAPKLTYIVPYNVQGKRVPKLSYGLVPFAIDASTGGLKDDENMNAYPAGTVSTTPLSEKPLGEEPKAGNFTEKQAVEVVKSAFKLPAEAELNGSNYSEQNDEGTGKTETFWQLYWMIKKDGKETGSASATVDARTGAIRSFNNYYYSNDGQSGTPKVTLEQASALAIETVKKRLPWLADELYFIKPDPKQYESLQAGENRRYYFSFVHQIHGATVDYDSISVTVDSSTGEVTSYDAYLSGFEYPVQAPAVLGKGEAVAAWLDYYRIQLTYRLVQQFYYNGQPLPIEKYKLMVASGDVKSDKVKTNTEAELVFQLIPRLIDEAVFLDAETGSWRNRETGEVTQLEKPKAKDIEGHWAQRQLELMVAYKALDVKNGEVRPNEAVTRGELIKMLVLARSSGNSPIIAAGERLTAKASFNDVAADSSYFLYVESALEQNLIDLGDGSFNPSGKVSRDEMAELIVRALGYNALANYDHIFMSSFKDSAQIENKGQAAIVVGLQIMSLADGKFLPKKQVTRGEASVAFFRYLQSRAELKEAPIRM
ncbi:YcdB/YcdC domain-containing protein [Paenibacillus sinopodophylli]|uniref:YcdB/YcdC domain-containing protein n=1 Tax=Paenibacillus sinopodophylli TaxID=1837342 RepID=UPI00110CD185|nr:YcdB/YcdC domain-containing protein [Paenibacillus sinopodophylli]